MHVQKGLHEFPALVAVQRYIYRTRGQMMVHLHRREVERMESTAAKYLIQWVSPRLYIYIGVYTASTGIKVVLQLRHIAFDHLHMLHVNHLATGLFVLIFVQVCPL